MTITAVSLQDGSREMVLAPRPDIRVQELDAPFPAVREEVDEATDDDGTDDVTEFFGARAVSVKLLVLSGPRAVEDELARFSHPRTRPYLVVTDDEWDAPRRLQLRVDQQSKPVGVDLAPSQRSIQAQWKAPTGVWEAADEAAETVNADLVGDPVGLSFPVTLPASFAATMSTGASTLTSLGAVPAHFVAQIYGPCTGPRLVNETTGEEITFTSALTLGAGEYVEVDTRERSAVMNSIASSSVLGQVDFTVTSWWRVEPGDQQIRYAPAGASSGAVAVINYRPAWL
jgi:hypothetical protein